MRVSRWIWLSFGLVACSFSGPPSEVASDGAVLAPDASVDAVVVTEDCGNGALDPDEACDDGDTAPGDGCDDACQIEPGFECDGDSCAEVMGLQWDGSPDPTAQSVGDSNGGSGFQVDCPTGAVAVGFDGIYGTDCGNAGGGVGRLELGCAELGFDAGGAATRIDTSREGMLGVCDPPGTISAGTIDCPAGSVLAGVRGNTTGYLGRLEGICRPLSHLGGALTFGDPAAATGTIGPTADTVELSCPAGEVVAGVSGRDGQVIDRLRLRCVAIETF